MTVTPRRPATVTRRPGRPLPLAVPALVCGVPLLAVGTALAWLLPGGGAATAAVLAVGVAGFAAVAVALDRRPWLAPWPVLIVFASSAELRLRVSDSVGVLKDAIVALLTILLVVQLVREQQRLRRLATATRPLAALGVVVGLYLIDPAGGHGSGWLFGTRLLLESLALLALGLLCAHPDRTLDHLVRAFTVVLPFEAIFAWVQQLAGEDRLVFGWGYQYGAQVRATSGGGLRTSGTFEDPFQLAALAVLGLALALFVASRRQAQVLIVASVAVLAATSVRTALLQAGLLLVIWAVRRGWWRQAVVLGGVGIVAVLYVLATTTSAVTPGAEEEPLLLTLNGRSTAWSLAVTDTQSFFLGNGVGARGIGSTRAPELVSAAPAYDPTAAPPAAFAGDPAFLDSAYAQVQSDIGIVGTLALVTCLVGLVGLLARRTARNEPAAWAALAVLLVSMVDWVGRSSLASYTTGFLTMYVLGVLVAHAPVRRW